MRYLGKFNLESDIQNALNNDELLKPYVAIYGNDKIVDINIKNKIEPSIFTNIATSNDIEYSFNAQVSWHSSEVTVNNFSYVTVNSIPQSIKNYILNGNHDRWYILQTPIYLKTLTVEGEGSGNKLEVLMPYFNNETNIDTTNTYNEINMVKYDETTETLYLSRGNLYYYYELYNFNVTNITNTLFPNLRHYENFESYDSSNYNGFKIFYDNSVNDFVITGAEIANVETNNDLIYDTENELSNMKLLFIPSILIDHIENYLNNEWNGNEITLSNTIILKNGRDSSGKTYISKISITTYNNDETLLAQDNSGNGIYINLTTLLGNLCGEPGS